MSVTQYQPLFLKYRPQALADLIGQQYVAKTLVNAIEHKRISHAYLFTGPRGTGKTSSARILAKSLNCEKGPTTEPCQVCASCVEIKQGNSSSVFEIDAASNNSVDDARLLIERAPLVAQGGRYKIYIIDECHMLTKEAFNALLKTIEEPPPQVIFVLATTEEQKVLPTIVSRCQRLMFKLVSHGDLVNHLTNIAAQEKINIEPAAVQFIARRSGGGLRDALGLLDQASLLSAPNQPVTIQDLLLLVGALDEDIVLKIAQFILAGEGDKALSAVHELLKEGREPYLIAFELAKHFLAVAKASYVTEAVSAESIRSLISGSPEYIEKVIAQAHGQDRSELSQMVELLDRLEQTCKRSSQPALNLEIGVLSLCHRLDLTELRALKERIVALESNAYNDAPPPANLIKPAGIKPSAPPPAAPVHSASPTPVQSTPPPASPAPPPVAAASPPAHFESAADFTNEEPPEEIEPIAVALPVEAEPESDQGSDLTEPSKPKPIEAKVRHDDADDIEPLEEEGLSDAPPSMTIFDEPARPVAAVAMASPSPAEDETSSGQDQNHDIDALWSDLLEELQRRSIPTFSLVSTHAFPLALTNSELTIGVLVETFQKMIEGKAEHIKTAAQTVSGKSLFIKVKVAGPDNKRKAETAPKAKPQRERNEEASPLKRASDSVETEIPTERTMPSLQAQATAPAPSSAQPVDGFAAKSALRQVASNIITEAYKLFEGPGSRLITSN